MFKNLSIILFLMLFLVACTKDKQLEVSYETIGGTWYMISNICDSEQYFNTYYPEEGGPDIIETSCSTTIKYDLYIREIERKLTIDDHQFRMEYTRLYQHPDYDSTYSSCELQCCLVDTDVVDYVEPNTFALNFDKKGFVLILEFGNISGSAHYQELQEFQIMKLTKDTLIFSGGGGPGIISLMDSHSCIYTFVR